jgi:hypothetical protein
VINPIQSQRQNPSRQPSPCVCRFHRLNPLWLNRRRAFCLVSKEGYGMLRRKFRKFDLPDALL